MTKIENTKNSQKRILQKLITLFFRIISLPFIAGIWLIFLFRLFVINMYRYVRYGGEMIVYMKSDEKSIIGIYNELKKQNEKSSSL